MSRQNTKHGARRQAPRNSTHKPSMLPAFVSGVVVGALGMYLVPVLFSGGEQQSIQAQREAAMAEDKKQNIKFDFYTLLKETEIMVPDGGEETPDKPAQNQPEDNYAYLLQVGSFINPSDADSLRVNLIMLNLDASVESVGQNGSTWHRVLVGPFDNTSKMASARARLAENGIDSLLLKRK